MATSSTEGAVQRRSAGKPARTRSRQPFYASQHIAARADSVSSVSVDISIHASAVDLDALRQAGFTLPEARRKSRGKAGAAAAAEAALPEAMREALGKAAAEVLSHSFGVEIGKVVEAYRLMLRESLAKGEDPQLKSALNVARLQEKILASASMVDQAQACRLLGLSEANPSATMKRKEDKQGILRFTMDGRVVYPLFQFDVEGRCLVPAMARLIAKKPKSWSDFRLLHWLTRPHLDFDTTPAEALKLDAEAVLAAFEREIEPVMHG